MIQISNEIQSDYPNAFAKAKQDRPWVTRKSVNEYRVVPRKLRDGSREHGKYVVRIVKWGNRIFADCVNVITGEVCKSTLGQDRFCYHRAAALLRVQKEESTKAA